MALMHGSISKGRRTAFRWTFNLLDEILKKIETGKNSTENFVYICITGGK